MERLLGAYHFLWTFRYEHLNSLLLIHKTIKTFDIRIIGLLTFISFLYKSISQLRNNNNLLKNMRRR